MEDKTLNAAVCRLVAFMEQDEDMKKMTQQQLQGFLKYASHVISEYTGSVTLQEIKVLGKNIVEI